MDAIKHLIFAWFSHDAENMAIIMRESCENHVKDCVSPAASFFFLILRGVSVLMSCAPVFKSLLACAYLTFNYLFSVSSFMSFWRFQLFLVYWIGRKDENEWGTHVKSQIMVVIRFKIGRQTGTWRQDGKRNQKKKQTRHLRLRMATLTNIDPVHAT